MEILIWACVMSVLVIALFVYLISHEIYANIHDRGVRERNANRLSKIQSIFSKISIGQDYSLIYNEFNSCEAVSTAKLISETMLENGVIRKVYIWYLDWDYTDGTTTSISTMPFQSSTINTGGNGMSFHNGVASNYTTGITSKKAHIQMVFENDKLVAKEQKGLF